MEFIQNYVPTSKAQLLQVAMYFNGGNIDKAQEMFDFYSRNLNLPDFDPVVPTFMEQMKGSAADLFSWIKNNQEDIVNGVEYVRSIVSKNVAKGEPLPQINE